MGLMLQGRPVLRAAGSPALERLPKAGIRERLAEVSQKAGLVATAEPVSAVQLPTRVQAVLGPSTPEAARRAASRLRLVERAERQAARRAAQCLRLAERARREATRRVASRLRQVERAGQAARA